MLYYRDPDQCRHARWCRARAGEPHAADCPREVLKLADSDVAAFCARYVRKESHRASPASPTVTDLVGKYDGRRASTNDLDDERASRRWLAEELLIHARLGSPRL